MTADLQTVDLLVTLSQMVGRQRSWSTASLTAVSLASHVVERNEQSEERRTHDREDH
jgi:hypothetical protein